MKIRADLLALDAGTLAELANRGLVKRAVKELDAGAGAMVSPDGDDTLHGRFPDGTRAALPPGAGLGQGTCTCGAPGICRHLLGLVLAYQRTAAAPGPSPTTGAEGEAEEREAAVGEAAAGAAAAWSPGDLDDEALASAVGSRAVAAARRVLARGYTAQLHHPTAEEPVAWAELPTCTVRFPVPAPDGVGHAVTDAAGDRRGEMIVLAVWAFRAAVDDGPAGPLTQVDVGGSAARSSSGGPELDTAAALLHDLLLDGAGHAGPVLATALRRVRDQLSDRALHWPAGTLTELVEQLDDHAARGARYRAERHALLITEFHARLRAARAATDAATGATDETGTARRSPLAVSQVLGSGERGDTALRRVRLTALGCRISGTPQDRTAEVFLAHGAAGTALVLRRRWELAEGQEPTGPELAARRLAGSSLGAVARGNLVSDSASRTPARSVVIGGARLASTGVTPVGSAWEDLPEPLLLRDFAAHARALEQLPPFLVRPRIEADSVHVVEVHAVEEIGYDPAQQRLEARVRDARGAVATVSAAYNPYSPDSLDVLAGALDGGRGEVRYLSAFVHGTGHGLSFDPIAVMTAEGVTVPDLAPAPATGSVQVAAVRARPRDPLAGALEAALAALATAAGRGLRHLGEGARAELEEAAAALARTGLATSAARVRAFLAAHRQEGPRAAVGPWLDAQIQLLTALELQGRQGVSPL
ncbi:hypothetical protein [Streptomyces sp. NBC_01408]|uniref:hypothetical protein n=1 Tax=Streptomyces sp. NBC_01408 TaxID=2903855 RepID=UPI002253E6DE|nr:hypothetical protein [Streptomyces sp. NBC_01408]MCX4695555.1 hypothetical protein [Streptomyces sp. NBC_01408]